MTGNKTRKEKFIRLIMLQYDGISGQPIQNGFANLQNKSMEELTNRAFEAYKYEHNTCEDKITFLERIADKYLEMAA